MAHYNEKLGPESFPGDTAYNQGKHRARYQCTGEGYNHGADKDLINLIHFSLLYKR